MDSISKYEDTIKGTNSDWKASLTPTNSNVQKSNETIVEDFITFMKEVHINEQLEIINYIKTNLYANNQLTICELEEKLKTLTEEVEYLKDKCKIS